MRTIRTFLWICSLFSFTCSGAKTVKNPKVRFSCDIDVTILEGDFLGICAGSDTLLHASPGFLSYNWAGPSSGSGDNLQVSLAGMYVVSATDALGCVSSDTIQITVYQNPVGIIASSEGTQLCTGQSTVLSVTELFYAFEWGNGSTSQAIQVNQGGTYQVEVTDVHGCRGLSTITLFYPNFEINVSDDTLCQGETVQLTASGATQYTWFNGEASASIALTPASDLTCTVELKKWNCTETLSALIHILPISQEPIDTLYYTDASTRIVLNAPSDFASYSWNPSTYLSSAFEVKPLFEGTETTLYVVTSTNAYACSRSDTLRVVVLNLNIPSGFSPNGDQINDVFVVEELTGLPVRLTVFNRWGEEVFSSERYEQNWDGSCQSTRCPQKEALPEGTYFYSLEVHGLKRSGYIALKR